MLTTKELINCLDDARCAHAMYLQSIWPWLNKDSALKASDYIYGRSLPINQKHRNYLETKLREQSL